MSAVKADAVLSLVERAELAVEQDDAKAEKARRNREDKDRESLREAIVKALKVDGAAVAFLDETMSYPALGPVALVEGLYFGGRRHSYTIDVWLAARCPQCGEWALGFNACSLTGLGRALQGSVAISTSNHYCKVKREEEAATATPIWTIDDRIREIVREEMMGYGRE